MSSQVSNDALLGKEVVVVVPRSSVLRGMALASGQLVGTTISNADNRATCSALACVTTGPAPYYYTMLLVVST
jgi:hypothetical protein